MNLKDYLVDRLVDIIIGAVCIALVAVVVAFLGIGNQATALVVVILASGVVACLIYGYVRRQRYYCELCELIDTLDGYSQSYLVSELIEPPDFYEGRLSHEAMRVSNKSMNEEVAKYRSQAGEYREYIELWIHDIKTPIAAAHLMTVEMKGAQAVKIKGELSRIEALVEQALYYARSTSIEKDYSIREIFLANTCRDAIKKHASFLIGKQTTPSLDMPDDLTIFADGKWLQYVIGQIIVNSTKYGAATIRLSAESVDEGTVDARIVLTIADDGCGIPATDVPRVFEKGFTGENGRQLGSSTGMGLYLCAQMCERMGLGIGIASEEGSGTRVMLAFPHDRRALEILR